MAQDSKKKFVTHRSPAGIAVYPRVNAPDFKFKKEGEYSTKLKLLAEDSAAFAEFLTAANEAAFGEIKAQLASADDGKKKAKAKTLVQGRPPFEPEVDSEGNETGALIFKFARKASGTSLKTGKPWKASIGIFDAKGERMDEVAIWGGTTMKVAFYLNTYYVAADNKAGVSCKLEAVQVLNLVTQGQRDASHYGFGQEAGYTVSKPDADGEPDSESGEDAPPDKASAF